MKRKNEYVEHYRVLQKKLGKDLTRMEASQEFNKVYALMRLVFKHQFLKRSERLEELLKKRSNINNP